MDGRKRTVQIKFRVTEAERDLILEKMKLVPTRNMAAYLRKIAIDGYIIQIDHADIASSLLWLWICYAIERRFAGVRYKSLSPGKSASAKPHIARLFSPLLRNMRA